MNKLNVNLEKKGIVTNCLLFALPFLFLFGVVLLMIMDYKLGDTTKNEIVSGDLHVYRGQTIPVDYIPSLVELSERASWLKTKKEIDIRAKESLEKMILDAEKEGMCLVVMGAYRSPEYQKEIYDSVSSDKKMYVAKPYESEHQTGLAVDFTGCPLNSNGVRDDGVKRDELKNDFSELPEYCWLVKNAYKYGFEQSFTYYNEEITGFPAEPWHFKFLVK